MATDGQFVLRRTWPQRFVLLACLGVIAAALVAAWFVQTLYDGLAEVGRIEISREVLVTETEPGEPVNFLLVGTDSAEGLDPDDPVNIGREVDPRGRHNADSISILRLDPRTGRAWVMAIPRDLYVDIADATPNRINATLLIEGPELLIETVSQTFGIEINHYIVLDFLGFREVVDRLGGVPVWFDHEARSEGTGLSILAPGCHVLDGEEGLQYVRARDYQEFIDGEWTAVGNADFGRIERQQDFLVLTLDRAVQGGARNPRTLAQLIEAGAQSVELDQDLTVAELAELGRSFSSFDPESLARFTPEVTTEYRGDGVTYLGEVLVAGANEEMFDIFRGRADDLNPGDVSFDLFVADAVHVDGDAALLAAEGFDVGRVDVLGRSVEGSVVIHPPSEEEGAILVARHLIPIPALIEDPDASGTTVVLGTEHEQVTFLFPHPYDTAVAAIDDRGDVELPELAATTVDPPDTTETAVAPPSSPSSISPTTTAGITGRPPEGESCG